MKIGLISDTHIPSHTAVLPSGLDEIFRGVELILHAGDIQQLSVLDELETIAPVLAALGNTDNMALTNDRRVKVFHDLELDGLKIRLEHKEPQRTVFPDDDKPEIIVCGHTHRAKIENSNGILVINPGSATYPPSFESRSVAILNTNNGKPRADIIKL